MRAVINRCSNLEELDYGSGGDAGGTYRSFHKSAERRKNERRGSLCTVCTLCGVQCVPIYSIYNNELLHSALSWFGISLATISSSKLVGNIVVYGFFLFILHSSLFLKYII